MNPNNSKAIKQVG